MKEWGVFWYHVIFTYGIYDKITGENVLTVPGIKNGDMCLTVGSHQQPSKDRH